METVARESVAIAKANLGETNALFARMPSAPLDGPGWEWVNWNKAKRIYVTPSH